MHNDIDSRNERHENLYAFAEGLVTGGNGKILFERYRNYTSTVTPEETMYVLDRLLDSGYPFEKVKEYTGKIINVFFRSLETYSWEKPGEGHFLHYLMLENREAEKVMAALRLTVKRLFSGTGKNDPVLYNVLLNGLKQLSEYELHYVKKENVLFPYIEKCFPQYRCIKIMWSFHDDFRRSIKSLESVIESGTPDLERINKALGKLFFVVLPVIFREEHIVFPVALRALPPELWDDMLRESFETGWCYGVKPVAGSSVVSDGFAHGLLDLGTGILSAGQVKDILNALPVDITFVDENDEVRYFSGSVHRIFPRSNAIIGRKVQNCHPPDSVHIVNEIIEAFRKGVKDSAEFWITMKGRFIHIRYFAVRTAIGSYAGTLEVSQDVTEIRKLSGEQRLLDWNKT